MIANEIYDVVIVGSGPAGLTAAIYTQRAGLKTIVLAGNMPGGQLTITTMVENYPGFAHGTGGVALMMAMQEQVKNLGVEIRNGNVKSIKNKFEIELESGEILKSKAVIVATGASAKWLGLEHEMELMGKGVSGCATCDGMFFRGKTVAVIGGGAVACEDASFLSKMANKVYMVVRRDEFRATLAEQNLVLNNEKVEILWNHETKEINSKLVTSNQKLENILIKNNKTGEEKILPIDGLFVAIGRTPSTQFLNGVVELKENSYVITGKNEEYVSMTNVPGIFAAGDCMDEIYRQAVVAAGAGAKAGIDVERWLKTI